MTLTKTERWILSNQYRILEALHPDEAEELARVREALENGYEWEYRYMVPYILDQIMSPEKCMEVRDILTVFNEIKYWYGQLSDKSGIDTRFLEFPGFSGNTESDYLGYARYTLADEHQFPRVRRERDMDSHAPFLPNYRRMLSEYKKSPNPQQLGHADLIRILAVSGG